MRLILFLCLFFFSIDGFSQMLQEVTNETLVVNSKTSLSGNTRNFSEVKLPANSSGYIYRISVFPKGKTEIENSLFSLLNQYGEGSISLAGSFAKFAVQNNDNNAVDAFIFSNNYDADKFMEKDDGNWSACKAMANRVNCCFATSDCMSRRIFFGFRNNNISEGLDVKLEVVAIIDTLNSVSKKHYFNITNPLKVEIPFLLSTNKINWEQQSLRSNYGTSLPLDGDKLYIKIYTSSTKFVSYQLVPDERYKFIWNDRTEKVDIIKY